MNEQTQWRVSFSDTEHTDGEREPWSQHQCFVDAVNEACALATQLGWFSDEWATLEWSWWPGDEEDNDPPALVGECFGDAVFVEALS